MSIHLQHHHLLEGRATRQVSVLLGDSSPHASSTFYLGHTLDWDSSVRLKDVLQQPLRMSDLNS